MAVCVATMCVATEAKDLKIPKASHGTSKPFVILEMKYLLRLLSL